MYFITDSNYFPCTFTKSQPRAKQFKASTEEQAHNPSK